MTRAEIITAFWEQIGKHAPAPSIVQVAKGQHIPTYVLDSEDQPIPVWKLALAGQSGTLFFIDREPEKAWPHRCIYVLLAEAPEGLRFRMGLHMLPPSAIITFEPCPRPEGL